MEDEGAAMKRLWSAWVALTSAREVGASLALFRIAVSAVVIYALCSMIAADLVDVMWVDAKHGGLQQLGQHHWLIALLGGQSPRVAWTLVSAGLVLATCMLVGFGGRITALITGQVYFALTSGHPALTGGYDMLITNALWLMVLGDSTATWSLDCRVRGGTWRSQRLIAAWPRYLVILQLVVVYTTTGLKKVSPVWTPGGDHSALYWVFQEPTWRRFDMTWTASAFWLTQIGSAVTWWWEVLTPLLLLWYWARHTTPADGAGGRLRAVLQRFDLRKAWAAIGIGMHLGIFVLLNVGPFSPISLAYYLCLIPPEKLARPKA
jgi:hypothetical protein